MFGKKLTGAVMEGIIAKARSKGLDTRVCAITAGITATALGARDTTQEDWKREQNRAVAIAQQRGAEAETTMAQAKADAAELRRQADELEKMAATEAKSLEHEAKVANTRIKELASYMELLK